MAEYNDCKKKLHEISSMPIVEDLHHDKILADLRYGQVEIKSSSKVQPDCDAKDILNGQEALKGGKYVGCLDEDGLLHIKFEFKRPVKFSGYDVQSGNDCPFRDPRKWKIKVTTLEGRKIRKEEECEPFGDRYEYKHFNMPEVVWTKKICIKFGKCEGYEDFAK